MKVPSLEVQELGGEKDTWKFLMRRHLKTVSKGGLKCSIVTYEM